MKHFQKPLSLFRERVLSLLFSVFLSHVLVTLCFANNKPKSQCAFALFDKDLCFSTVLTRAVAVPRLHYADDDVADFLWDFLSVSILEVCKRFASHFEAFSMADFNLNFFVIIKNEISKTTANFYLIWESFKISCLNSSSLSPIICFRVSICKLF